MFGKLGCGCRDRKSLERFSLSKVPVVIYNLFKGIIYLTNRPPFLSVYQGNNPLRILGEHETSLKIANRMRVSYNQFGRSHNNANGNAGKPIESAVFCFNKINHGFTIAIHYSLLTNKGACSLTIILCTYTTFSNDVTLGLSNTSFTTH